jgi:hypothetical protein
MSHIVLGLIVPRVYDKEYQLKETSVAIYLCTLLVVIKFTNSME